MKLCVVTHTYVDPNRRTKLREYAKRAVTHLLTPTKWESAFAVERHKTEQGNDKAYFIHGFKAVHIVRRTSTSYFLRGLGKKIKEIDPDIVQVENELHSILSLQVILIVKRLYKLKARMVVFSWANVKSGSWKQRLIDFINRRVISEVDFFVSGNESNRRILKSYGVPDSKIAVLPQYGIDPRLFKPLSDKEKTDGKLQLGIEPSDVLLGFVGRLVEEKGLSDLLHAFRILRNRWRVSLLIVGKGPLQSKLCEEDGMRIVSADYSGVSRNIGLMDILVLPSRTTHVWAEQFGHVLIEAMACAVVPIGSNSGAIPEVIGKPENIFPEGDWEALVTLLETKMGDRRQLELEKNYFLESSKRFRDDVIAEQYFRIYEGLINEPG